MKKELLKGILFLYCVVVLCSAIDIFTTVYERGTVIAKCHWPVHDIEIISSQQGLCPLDPIAYEAIYTLQRVPERFTLQLESHSLKQIIVIDVSKEEWLSTKIGDKIVRRQPYK